MLQANLLVNDAFCCNFVDFDQNSKKMLIFLMANFNQGIRIFASGLFKVELNIQILGGIFKTAYSYFTVLSNM